jgi:hypothetical protein
MSTIKGGIAAYKDCAELCDRLLSREFPRDKTPDLTDAEMWAAELATKMILNELSAAFKAKANALKSPLWQRIGVRC